MTQTILSQFSHYVRKGTLVNTATANVTTIVLWDK